MLVILFMSFRRNEIEDHNVKTLERERERELSLTSMSPYSSNINKVLHNNIQPYITILVYLT